jgi:hypothetical protein
MQHNEQRASHGTEGEEALSQIADALLDDVVDNAGCFAFICLVCVSYLACYAERVGVEWGLWDEAIGERNAKEAGDTGCKA